MIKPTRRSVLQAGAAGAVALSVPATHARAAKRGGVLRVGKAHGQTIDSFDPGTHENGFTIPMAHGYHIYMTAVAPDGGLARHLAESWEASADATRWWFRLREGVTYHNGRSVTADDVVASINFHRGDASTSAAKPIVSPITDIRAVGKGAVIFDLESGNADFPFILSDYHLPIMPSDEGKPDWQSGIGAGAYRIKAFNPGVRVDLERNPDYWDSDAGFFDEIQMLTIVDPATRTNALIAGAVDAIDRVDLKTVHLLRRRPGVNVTSVAGNQHYTFPMRTNLSPYDNNHVRLALKYAIKRDEIVEKVLQGYGVVGNDHPIGPGQRYFAKNLPQRTYDPDKAKFHLKKAGYDRLEVNLQVADAAFAGAIDAGSLYAESARAAGLDINVVREPNDGYWSNVWNTDNGPFCACYWGGRVVEDQMFSTAYAGGAPWNDARWSNARFDTLLVAARAELDDAKRAAMYAEMQELVRDDGGTVIPMFASYVFATSDKVHLPAQIGSNWAMDGERWMERWSFA